MLKTLSIFFSLTFLLALTLVFTACDDDDNGTDPSGEVTSLIAGVVATPPTLDGNGSDAAWTDASEFIITVGESGDYSNEFGEIDVSLKAVRTSTDVYILASWADATESVDKKLWSYVDGAWETGGNEDRMFWMWDAGNNGTEGANCSNMCHVGDGMMRTSGGGNVDVWHWKSARTAPTGCSDDKWWDDGSGRDGDGRGSDAKTVGAYSDNKQELSDGTVVPKYSGPVTDGHFIIIPVGSDAETYCIPFDTLSTTGTYPGYYLNANRDGSRFNDVMAESNYSGGRWTVEFKRAIDTGHDDDVAFTIGGTTSFSLAVTDNSGGSHSGAGEFDFTLE